ncbi:MAG: MBL fold metallo-hydrolase [Gemmatimonadota bacterium]
MTGASTVLRDDIFEAPELAVWRFVLNDILTNGFVARDVATGALLIVDPGARAEDLVSAAGRWGGDVQWLLVTHLHEDHWAAVETVQRATGGRIAAPAGGAFRVDQVVAGGETLAFGATEIQVYATPGHAPEHVSFRVGGQMFVGDFLFRLGSGRTDGARASATDLFAAVRDVFSGLPDDTVLWCGHGPPSTVGEELGDNPFWQFAVAEAAGNALETGHYRGGVADVLAHADDYDGGTKALLRLADGSLVIVPGSQLTLAS